MGQIVASYDYDTWGNVIKSDAQGLANDNPFGYAGYMYDKETKLYYLIARYYQPETGVFLSLDPEPGDQDDALTQNGYTYANNNPVMFYDYGGNSAQYDGYISQGGAGVRGGSEESFGGTGKSGKGSGKGSSKGNGNAKSTHEGTSTKIKTGDKTPDGHSFSEHGAERANERGFSKKACDDIIRNNRKTRKSKIDGKGQKTWEYTDSRGNKVVTNERGGIVSVHSKLKGGHYIPKK
ncbi:RHS repeat-associated core domain-containing protein [Bacillus sp. AFS002410]|uniref:RHS repeat-associated core domain-containing protein n=1 Tax=Bacillus sp. AFS002410 TaxID=2033481 RepID=UPI003F8D84A6